MVSSGKSTVSNEIKETIFSSERRGNPWELIILLKFFPENSSASFLKFWQPWLTARFRMSRQFEISRRSTKNREHMPIARSIFNIEAVSSND